MSVIFMLRTKKQEGRAPLSARIISHKLGLDMKVVTTITVDVAKYTASPTGRVYTNYMKSAEGVKIREQMAKATAAIESYLRQGFKPNGEAARKIIDDVVLKETRERQPELKVEKRRKPKITLNKYIERFEEEIESGARQTDRGTNYSFATVKAIKQALNQFKYFQKEKKRKYDFDDIDMTFYYEFTAYLKKKDYAINSIGKCIKELKAIMRAAEIEGYHTNSAWKDKKFKGTRVEIDSIYLTQEDLDKIMAADLSKYEVGHTWARDIFMVGVWDRAGGNHLSEHPAEENRSESDYPVQLTTESHPGKV